MHNLHNLHNLSRLWSNGGGLLPRWPYTMQVGSLANVSPADNATLYIGNSLFWATLSATSSRLYPAGNGILKKCCLFLRASVLGSAETSTVKIVVNWVTEYTVSSSVTFTANSNVFINTNLNIPLNEWDFYCFKLESASRVTNPTFIFTAQVGIEPQPLAMANSKYLLQWQGTWSNWVASNTTFLGWDGIATNSSWSSRVYVPYTGTITAAFLNIRNSTNASAETYTVTIRKNNATDHDISTSAVANATNVDISNTSMSVPVTAGDWVTLKNIFPAWSVAPTGVSTRVTLVINT